MPQFCVAYTNMLVSKNAKICVTNANPQRKSMEYRLHWVPNTIFSRWQCTLHFFVLISFAFGGQRKTSFQWNMGLKDPCDAQTSRLCRTSVLNPREYPVHCYGLNNCIIIRRQIASCCFFSIFVTIDDEECS